MDSIPAKMQPQHDAIVALTDAFCQERLTKEYRVKCRQLAASLARKRPSPLVNGTPPAWACGIVRVIGWVNFLDDKTQAPHLKMTEIDERFGVSSATGQAKSKTIRAMLKIRHFDPRWTLPSKVDENPMAWMIQVNGLIVDARMMPTEVQAEAYQRGLIPYIPVDENEGTA